MNPSDVYHSVMVASDSRLGARVGNDSAEKGMANTGFVSCLQYDRALVLCLLFYF